ncbi:SIMPL domain-containing protein [Microbacterium sp.]|uniref:SIMPL domain-containing protein n=1 Tax=Microbacterium sp. TaxID=51671 RepID=UPI0039E38E4B
MSEVTITVRGEHEVRIAPERATVHLSVRADGPDRADAVERALRAAESVRESIIARHDAGEVIEWDSRHFTVHAERPWNADGRQLPPVYHVAVDFTATFGEASVLSTWATAISDRDGVEIGWVDWHLTPATRSRIEREVAAAAVGVAVARAEAYAAALGLHDVAAREIADTGLISRASKEDVAPMMSARGAAFAADAGAAEMIYETQELVLSATVEGRFVAR